jgi:hypothetical protein
VAPLLKDLHQSGMIGLDQLSDAVKRIKENKSFDELRPEIAKAKKAELIKEARQALMSFLQKEMDAAAHQTALVSASVYRVTDPERPTETAKALLQELRYQEIRQILRNIDPKDRAQAVKGNLAYLQALVDSPDKILSEKTLSELRREYAAENQPELIQKEKGYQQVYDMIRRRAGEINGASIQMLQEAGLDDPITPPEHFGVFMPTNERDAEVAAKRIQTWQKEQDQIQRRKEWEASHPGTSLEAGKPIPGDTSTARDQAKKIAAQKSANR